MSYSIDPDQEVIIWQSDFPKKSKDYGYNWPN